MSDLVQAIELLWWKLDDDPCEINHRGECENHGDMKGGGCWMVKAREVVARHRPKCPVCYPARWDEPPAEVALRPEACPMRDRHELITFALDRLQRAEQRSDRGLTEQTEQLRADLNRLRTVAA